MLSARALIAGGADVIAFDDDDKKIAEARAAGITTQDLRELDWSTIAALVLAPGVPLTHPAPHWTAALARDASVEVIGDIELFCRERAKSGAACPLVAITGTNGKSTTTALIAHLLKSAGRDAQMGGNIGVPVLALEPFAAGRVYVLEVSSYQIDLAPSLRATVGILLNVYGGSSRPPRQHGELRRDQRAAAGEVRDGGTAVIGVDDRMDARCRRSHRARRQERRARLGAAPLRDGYYAEGSAHHARHRRQGAGGGAARRHRFAARRAQRAERGAAPSPPASRSASICQRSRRGWRVSPASRTAWSRSAARAACLFVNDSKATNADSAAKALASFHDIFWIAGGKPKTGGIDEPRRILPAHPQGLSDRRGGGRIRRDARRQGAV